jgi:hypothetical protein
VSGIFRTTNPFSIIVLFFYGIILRYASFADPSTPVAQSTDGFLYHALLRSLANMSSGSGIIYPVLSYLLVFIQALMLNVFFHRHKLVARPNYLPALCYILVTSLFPEWCNLSSTLIINTFLIWAWNNMAALYKNPKAKQILFNTGIIIGLSSFFYFPSIGFIILLFASIMIMRPVSVPEWLIGLLGVTIPYYFLFAWTYLKGNWAASKFIPPVSVSYPEFQQTIWAWGGLLLLMIPFLISGFYIQNHILRMLIQVRKGWSLLLVYLLAALLIPFVNGTAGFEYWILSAVPFAAFHANVFYYPQKRLVPGVLHIAMTVFILMLNYFILKSA